MGMRKRKQITIDVGSVSLDVEVGNVDFDLDEVFESIDDEDFIDEIYRRELNFGKSTGLERIVDLIKDYDKKTALQMIESEFNVYTGWEKLNG